MRRDDRGRIDDGIARRNRVILGALGNPQRVEAEGRILAGAARHLGHQFARIEREHFVGEDLVLADDHPGDRDAIDVAGQRQVVGDLHRRHDEAEFLRQLAPDTGDPRHQRRALAFVDQADERIADFELARADVADIRPLDMMRVGSRGRGFGLGSDLGRRAPELPADGEGQRRGRQDQHLRHCGDKAEDEQDTADRHPYMRGGELAADLARQVVGRRHARDDGGGRDREQQRRNLGDERVTDRQRDIGAARLREGQAVAEHAQDQAADDVDEQDEQAGDGIALHEFRRTVHRAIEIGFGRDFLTPRLGFVGGQQAGVEIGVDRHLLAGQGVEGEARRHFGHASRALGDDDEVDDHQHAEHEQADDIIAADQHLAERFDHMARRRRAFVAVDEHDARRGDVERETEQRREQQDGREGRKIERLRRRQRDHQDREADHDIADEADVEDDRRDRDHHQRDENQHRRGQCRGSREARHIADVEPVHAAPPESEASRW